MKKEIIGMLCLFLSICNAPKKGRFFMNERENQQPITKDEEFTSLVEGIQETEGVCMRLPTKTSSKKLDWRRRFTSKRLAFMAVFVALSFSVSFFEFPIFPATPYLRLDLGNVFILLVSFLLGPVEGIIVCVLKEGLRAIGSSSGGVGEIVNILATSAYILYPSIIYQFYKGLKAVIPALIGGCFSGTLVALLTNRFITFPLYMGEAGASVFFEVFGFVVAFNLIKTVAVSVFTLLLYKRLSNFLKRMKF